MSLPEYDYSDFDEWVQAAHEVEEDDFLDDPGLPRFGGFVSGLGTIGRKIPVYMLHSGSTPFLPVGTSRHRWKNSDWQEYFDKYYNDPRYDELDDKDIDQIEEIMFTGGNEIV